MNYPVLVGRDEEELLDAFGPLYGFPTSFSIGRDGVGVREAARARRRKEDFEKEIKALL